MARRLIKLLHEIGGVGVIGAFAACLVLIITSRGEPPAAYAVTRQHILDLCRLLLLPSLALVVLSGLISIAVNEAYKNAGWAWVKALSGISLFEGTLLTVVGSARKAAELSAQAAAGGGDPEQLAQVLRTEWGGLWVLLVVALANIVLAIWRPRFTRKSS